MRRVYPVRMIINEWFIEKVVIDDHYELKHSESINDKLILDLVELLSNSTELRVSERDHYSYFVSELQLRAKWYRLIWLYEDNQDYIGIINAHRI